METKENFRISDYFWPLGVSVGGRFLISANASFFKPEPKHKRKNTR